MQSIVNQSRYWNENPPSDFKRKKLKRTVIEQPNGIHDQENLVSIIFISHNPTDLMLLSYLCREHALNEMYAVGVLTEVFFSSFFFLLHPIYATIYNNTCACSHIFLLHLILEKRVEKAVMCLRYILIEVNGTKWHDYLFVNISAMCIARVLK